MAQDPVCKMVVDEKEASAQGRRSEYQGQAYYFCSIECKKRFEQQKERYAGQAGPQSAQR